MATHMMYERMEPETPIRAPTVVRRGLSSMKPSATSANPEYAFRTVMTTAVIISRWSEREMETYAYQLHQWQPW